MRLRNRGSLDILSGRLEVTGGLGGRLGFGGRKRERRFPGSGF